MTNRKKYGKYHGKTEVDFYRKKFLNKQCLNFKKIAAGGYRYIIYISIC